MSSKLLISGIGGLATALSLHRVGIEVDIYEQAQELRELGVGINVLPHAVKSEDRRRNSWTPVVEQS